MSSFHIHVLEANVLTQKWWGKMVGWGRDNPQLVAYVHLYSDPDLGT